MQRGGVKVRNSNTATAHKALRTLHMQSVDRVEGAIFDIVDEPVNRGVSWNSLVILHSGNISLDAGLQICSKWHVVKAMDVVLCLLANVRPNFLQAVHHQLGTCNDKTHNNNKDNALQRR